MVHLVVQTSGFLNFDHFELDSSYNYHVGNCYLYIESPDCIRYIPMDRIIDIKIFDSDQWEKKLKESEMYRDLFSKEKG